jgi:hypothetical protein
MDGQHDTPAALLQGKKPLSMLQEAGLACLNCHKSLSPHRASNYGPSARRELLYRLSIPSFVFVTIIFIYSGFLDDAFVG